jgi:predicted dienelactone hydrolase
MGVGITAVVLAQGDRTSRAIPPRSTSARPITTVPKPTTIPTPTAKNNGPFAVGTTELSLVEAAPPGSRSRSIPAVVRYPSLGAPGGSEHPGADPDRTNGPYPLLVFSSGFDIAPEAYAALLESWATAGYVVVDPTYPLTGPGSPEGVDEADIVNHPADLRFVITSLLQASTASGGPLSGLIDASKVAVVGHSDGGDVSLATATNSCCRDPRVKVAIILSGAELTSFGGTYYQSGSVPLFVVQGTNDTLNPPACSVQLYNAAPPPKYYLSLLGAGHEPPYLQPGTDQSVVQEATKDFLDGYLKGSAVARAALSSIGSSSSQTVLSTAPSLPAVSGACPGAPSQ